MATLLSTISSEFAPLVQPYHLNRAVRDAIQPSNVWRRVAASDMVVFPSKIGMPDIITVRGLRAPNLTPNNVSIPSDPNAGMTPSGITYEQFQIMVNRYDGMDFVDMFARHIPIADKYLETLETLAQGASSTGDFLARNGIYTGGAGPGAGYLNGNTRVTATLGSAGTSVKVDDITGFVVPVPGPAGLGLVPTPTVQVGSTIYTLAAVVPDGTNASTLTFTDTSGTVGVSGTLVFTTNVSVADGTSGNAVVAVNAPSIIRAGGATSTLALAGAANNVSTLTANMILKAKNRLANNRVPRINGAYLMYANADALYGLYLDPTFQNFFRGGYDSSVWTSGEITKMLGVRIVEVDSCPIQYLNGTVIHRPIVMGAGCLTEARMTDTMFNIDLDGPAHVTLEDNIAFVTTAPTDRASQFVGLSYLQFVGYACRTDRGLTPAVVPTASNANLKRAVILECQAGQ